MRPSPLHGTVSVQIGIIFSYQEHGTPKSSGKPLSGNVDPRCNSGRLDDFVRPSRVDEPHRQNLDLLGNLKQIIQDWVDRLDDLPLPGLGWRDRTEYLEGKETSPVDAEQTLRTVPLFRGLQHKQLKSLARWVTTRTFQPGQVIVQEGQSGLGLYCIENGRVRVSQTSGGSQRDLRDMTAGESFGEISLLDDQPRSATVTAVEPTTVIVLDKSQFLAEVRTYPEVALAILPALVQRLREAETRSGTP